MVDLVALSYLPVWRWRLILEQLRHGVAPASILVGECARPSKKGRAPTPAELKVRAALAIERGRTRGLAAMAWDDPAMPPLLGQIPDPPPVLWVRGSIRCLEHSAVAIVGSRAGSPYALAVAERLGAELAMKGVVVVSGLARGVDAAAHRGALGADGASIGVLGCGADLVYPREHEALAGALSVRGALLSEFAPGTPPRQEFFPRRNRIISAISRAVVVVEAGEKSGSLITARCALEQGRDVLAVPGSILTGRNRGGHALIRDGARLVESVDDILEEIGLTPVPAGPGQGDPPPDDPVLSALWDGEPLEIEEIAARSGLPVASLLIRLMELELHGIVRRAGGGRFVRV